MRKVLSVALVLFIFVPLLAFAQRGKVKDIDALFTEPEIFLRPVHLIGRTAGQVVYLMLDPADCLDENGQIIPLCFVVPPPPTTLNWNEQGLESFKIPAKALRDILIVDLQLGVNFGFQNPTAGNVSGLLRHRVSITFESPALIGAVDPTTGQTLNGSWTLNLGQRRMVRMLQPGQNEADQINYTRRYFFSRTWIKQYLALSDRQMDQFFDNPIVVKMNLDGAARSAYYSNMSAWFAFSGY